MESKKIKTEQCGNKVKRTERLEENINVNEVIRREVKEKRS